MTPYLGNLKDTWWKDGFATPSPGWTRGPGPDWPFATLFTNDPTNSVSTKYFYKDDNNRRYELKIDNHLQEVYADPKKYLRNKNCTIDIATVDTDNKMKAFLDFGLNAPNDLTFMDNSKNPPVKRNTASKKRYLTKKTGKFIFP